MIAKSDGFDGDRSAIDEAMMERLHRPFASLMCRDAEILVEATNQVSRAEDITRHAEMVAISKAQHIPPQGFV